MNSTQLCRACVLLGLLSLGLLVTGLAQTPTPTKPEVQAARKQQPNPKAVARGVSAHMYGLAVDLNLKVPGLSIDNRATRADDKMANIVRMYRSPIYKWLALNGSRFGWFPYRNEPWHWEYNPPGFKARFEQKAP